VNRDLVVTSFTLPMSLIKLFSATAEVGIPVGSEVWSHEGRTE